MKGLNLHSHLFLSAIDTLSYYSSICNSNRNRASRLEPAHQVHLNSDTLQQWAELLLL